MNDSTAYDLQLFDPNYREEAAQNTFAVAHNRKSVTARKNALSNIALAVIFTLLFSVLIGSYSTLNEVTANLSSAKKEYQALVDVTAQLEVQLEQKINLGEIESLAINVYGMQKADQNSIQYISLMGEDEVQIIQEENTIGGFLSNLFVNIPFFD